MQKNNYILICCLLFVNCFFAQNQVVDSLKHVIETSHSDTTKAIALNNLFLEYEFEDPSAAKNYLETALNLSLKNNYGHGLVRTYTYLGYLSEDNAENKQALIYYNQALKLAEKIGDKLIVASSYRNIANIAYLEGDYPLALNNYFSCLKIEESIGDQKGLATTYNGIGNVYDSQKNSDKALENHFKSLQISKKNADKKGMANSYNNIGAVYYSLLKFDEALQNYYESLKIKRSINDQKGIASCLNNIGGIFSMKEQHDSALIKYKEALQIEISLDHKVLIASTYRNIGKTLMNQHKFYEARAYFNKSLELSKEIGYKECVRHVYSDFTELDSLTGDFKGAYENFKLYVLYTDSLNNEETRKKTIQSQMTYDFEKKEAVAEAEHKKELENQEILSEEKSRKQKIVLALVSCFLLLVVIFAGFIFKSLRTTRKQKNLIEYQKSIVEEQKKEVEMQKLLVEEHQKDIIDSITYARRIQRSLLPTEKYIDNCFKRLMKVK